MPGATAVGVTCDDSVVFGSERRIAYGHLLVSKTTRKTFQLTSNVGAACAGLVADMQILALQIKALAKIRRMEIRREVPPNTIAKMMSNMMYDRRFFPLLTQVIVGGFVDEPKLYTLDPLGSVLPDEYAAVGTGAEMALGVLDPQYTTGISTDDGIELVKKAINAASQRDASSGDGTDILVIKSDGSQQLTS
ncbi:MAG: proteasome subunit beta [Cenarchaeum sp. SB0665_bin_23]|nr:proteasome subunit beta [Cenarchaeum sp. SB0667_bin_13]MXY37998.1 proteasome subunit beta [Cenarchaeum sp. SB0664_bin_35]MXY60551.1 proteasome subunit beta [Cenarchaeum sp. SB0665_bin_23]MXZ93251.1 proteasome subunit beta [Cenarchaeum sp. SB0666_bin_15]MYB46668.1 proteasome subunit beta [Cenarchaeum sp. SB0662_bin_33]MYC80156.1 proteasome subunit beta [Cenarchaeum sp. SB0661_bin_35]MYD58498.1 proteasome subunit beta [Cenarchaeum sp. SB0678_bin_8]MYG32601.1 proteasome subunit beta [Cenarch